MCIYHRTKNACMIVERKAGVLGKNRRCHLTLDMDKRSAYYYDIDRRSTENMLYTKPNTLRVLDLRDYTYSTGKASSSFRFVSKDDGTKVSFNTLSSDDKGVLDSIFSEFKDE